MPMRMLSMFSNLRDSQYATNRFISARQVYVLTVSVLQLDRP